MNEVVERTRRKWMVLLLGLCGQTNSQTINAVKVSQV